MKTQSDAQAATQVRMLVVGDLDRWQSLGRLQAEVIDCDYIRLDELHAGNLHRIAPDLVVSALFAEDFDAVDVVIRLVAAQFSGRYFVLAPDLPNPAIVRNEIRAIAPELDFDLLMLPAP